MPSHVLLGDGFLSEFKFDQTTAHCPVLKMFVNSAFLSIHSAFLSIYSAFLSIHSAFLSIHSAFLSIHSMMRCKCECLCAFPWDVIRMSMSLLEVWYGSLFMSFLISEALNRCLCVSMNVRFEFREMFLSLFRRVESLFFRFWLSLANYYY